jgi:Domain of unknown function (DUF4419)
MYVNGHAEELRSLFVAHEGKQPLMIDVSPNLVWTWTWGEFTQQMVSLIQKNVMDADLKDWLMPNFTTTTFDDKSVAAILMMG